MLQKLETAGNEIPAYPPARTLGQAIVAHAASRPHAPAIVIEGRKILSYGVLAQQVERVGAVLKQAGIGAKNRVAIVMPDSGDLALAIAAVACHTTVVPLNPRLTAAEIDALFVSHRLDAIVLLEGADIPAHAAATQRGACLLAARSNDTGIELVLKTAPLAASGAREEAAPDDVLMILRTSGTTAKPKLVAVTHRNMQSMAARRQYWFGLGPTDRVLCIMPLYHAQGLFNALFAQLFLGGSLACPIRAAGAKFCDWLKVLEPTCYSAGPTFHRSVLEQAMAVPRDELQHRLRFIQSGAAPLPAAVHEGLERIFGVPIVDTYGLSEAGNISANTVAQEGRRRGTVGRAWPGELALRNEDGSIVTEGGPAEIVLRGAGVMPGYLDDEAANQTAFEDGWFRTGDLGCIDADGFLTVVGRIKEMINRGGEKLAPAEIDEHLQRHPAVAEAAAFPVPHPRLGEDVAAAVILRPSAKATELELRRFLQESLVPFKIPRRIHLVASLPKGETGKVLRQELTRIFSADAQVHAAQPSSWGSPLEIEIAELWERLLGRGDIGPEDDFFELGGDSLLATQMLIELEHLTGTALPDTMLFEAATIRQLASSVVRKEDEDERSLMVKLQDGTGKTPFFFIDGDFWGGGYYARKIARLLGPEYPFYSLRSRGLSGEPIPSIERMARDYKRLITATGMHGPFRIGGHCNGGLIAMALADQLEAMGERVEIVALVDSFSINARPFPRFIARSLDRFFKLGMSEAQEREARIARIMSLLWRVMRKTRALLKPRRGAPPARAGQGPVAEEDPSVIAAKIAQKNETLAAQIKRRFDEYHRAMAGYVPPSLSARLIVLVAEASAGSFEYDRNAWRNIASRRRIETLTIPGDHLTCITTHADALAARLKERFAIFDRAEELGL